MTWLVRANSRERGIFVHRIHPLCYLTVGHEITHRIILGPGSRGTNCNGLDFQTAARLLLGFDTDARILLELV